MNTSKKSLALKASKDLILSVLALVIYNGVLQLVIYPSLNKAMGETAFGTVLYLISIVSIMGAGFGTAASYSRMVAKKDRTETNGDYNIFLLIIAAISTVVTFIALLSIKELNPVYYALLLVLMIATVFRYYADVEYRMNIKFVNYFLFFLSVAVGYVAGLGVYYFTKNWVLVILLGELAGLVFTCIVGSIFKAPFLIRSDSFDANMKSVWTISASNLVAAMALHADKIILHPMVDSRSVTIFYTASLIGKIVAMLTTPLNGIIISYFTNYKIKLTRKIFSLMCLAALALSIVGAGVCMFVSYVFVKLFYPNLLAEASGYFFLANLGQILYFISGSLMVILLSFTKEKSQLLINLIYGATFLVLLIPATHFFGLMGMAVGLVVVNLIRLLVTAIFGLRALEKESKQAD